MASSSPVTRKSEKSSYKARSEEHTSELQSQSNLVCRLLLEKKSEHEQPRQDIGIAPVGQDHVRVVAVEQLVEPCEKLRAIVSLQNPLLSLHPHDQVEASPVV